MQRFISPTVVLDNTITPDLLYSIGIVLQPEPERALLGKLRLVVGRRVAHAVGLLLSPELQRELVVLSEYASRDAVQRWLRQNVPSFADIVRGEGLILKAELFRRAAEIQASQGERGIPDWSDYWAEEGEAA